MKIRWSAVAIEDLTEIFEFIASDNPDVAADVIGIINRSADQLLTFPQLGRPGRVEGTRELVLMPYVLLYRIHAEAIIIEAVIHGARIV